MLSKIKNSFKNSRVGKYVMAAFVTASIAAMSCLNCFAAEGDSVSSSLSTAFTQVKTDIFSYIGIILPIALAVFGAFFGIKKAIAFFKSSAGK